MTNAINMHNMEIMPCYDKENYNGPINIVNYNQKQEEKKTSSSVMLYTLEYQQDKNKKHNSKLKTYKIDLEQLDSELFKDLTQNEQELKRKMSVQRY